METSFVDALSNQERAQISTLEGWFAKDLILDDEGYVGINA
jgi:hypothetical protein